MTTDDLRPARPREEQPPPPPAAPAAPDVPPPAPAPAPPAPPAAAGDDEALALERGRTAAVVAALGRMQMSVDVLSRRIASLEATVKELRGRPGSPPPGPPAG